MAEQSSVRKFDPSLISVLLDGEKKKGAPLSEEEVVLLRDHAATVDIPVDEIAKFEADRGYDDIEGENCWTEWQHVRLQFLDSQ